MFPNSKDINIDQLLDPGEIYKAAESWAQAPKEIRNHILTRFKGGQSAEYYHGLIAGMLIAAKSMNFAAKEQWTEDTLTALFSSFVGCAANFIDRKTNERGEDGEPETKSDSGY